jgi:hypothetical protein
VGTPDATLNGKLVWKKIGPARSDAADQQGQVYPFRLLKGLSNQFFTLSPERGSSVWIERILAYSFADVADDHVVRNDVAVLAVTAADLVG